MSPGREGTHCCLHNWFVRGEKPVSGSKRYIFVFDIDQEDVSDIDDLGLLTPQAARFTRFPFWAMSPLTSCINALTRGQPLYLP